MGATMSVKPLSPEAAKLVTNEFAAYERDLKADVMLILNAVDAVDVLRTTEAKLKTWVEAVEVMMSKHANPYHHFIHVCDVTQFMFYLLQSTNLRNLLHPRRVVALMLAAMMHDLEHPGKSNVFQINAKTELALKWDLKSPLENHHAEQAELMLKKHELLSGLPPAEQEDITTVIRETIMATDMSRHGEIIKAFKEKVLTDDPLPTDPKALEPVRYELFRVLLKCCDISNPARPRLIAHWWNEACYQEFYGEGDADRAAGRDVNPLHDRANNVIPKSSVGFINFCVLPLMQLLAQGVQKISSETGHAALGCNPEPVVALCAQLKQNAANYGALAEEHAARAAEAEKESDTLCGGCF